ncbi:PfkB family carbohydrate kinase [Propioniciclava sinopodophylli]|uniref:PfkB family carbohydrate kinase n=1 Tax=Propioniciclava sinopodophylli TaxID=1837344 RepID=UPI002490F08F|nr:PfkB family carbohydrate kinase [Propioniciclava sinopodophylli]
MTNEPSRPRTALRGREDLSIFWDNHLRVAFEASAKHDLPAMVEASLAHVLMLRSTGALPPERADLLLSGLRDLWARFGPEAGHTAWTPKLESPHFDGSVEDPYYFLEQELAAACGIDTADLDVQLARSRNDLDAAVFRMILRRGILDVADLLLQTTGDLADKAEEHAGAVIIGNTHRRPAQPTTIGHVLAGLAETLLSQADDLLCVYDEMNTSPLGAAAFTGTDISIDATLVADLLGFDRVFTSSYEAVAGAEHFMRLAAVHARITATGARWARVLQEWMNLRWVVTPTPFTQGSSIMPQKKNPVVLEHMVSMASAESAELASVYGTIASGWYEDSNNATTDVQKPLWNSTDRVIRFLRLYDGLVLALEPDQLPTSADIVRSGATTTAVAEALAMRSVPWRAAHSLVGRLFRAGEPLTWTADQVAEALSESGIADPSGDLAALVLASGREPGRVLEREQPGSPGLGPVRATVGTARERVQGLANAFGARRTRLDRARDGLLDLAADRTGRRAQTLTVIGNANLDVIANGVTGLPSPGTERIIDGINVRLGGSAAITAQRAAQLEIPTRLVAKVGQDAAAALVADLLDHPALHADLVIDTDHASGLTIAVEAPGRDRAFLSSLGAMSTFRPADVPDEALKADVVLCAGYFLLPGLQRDELGALLERAQRGGTRTALDTGHPDTGWTDEIRADLRERVLPHVDLFLPNESELTGLTGKSDVLEAAANLVSDSATTVVAKLGAGGALVADKNGVRTIEAPRVTPVDTTGAGDSFNAAFLGALMRGFSIDEATAFAVTSASALVAAPPSERDDVLRRMGARHLTPEGSTG